MAKTRIVPIVGRAAVRKRLAEGADADRETSALAVRFLLQQLADEAPGHTVEVRVPPFGAVQCVEGPQHTRGTPPNVVEMNAGIWLELATGALDWPTALAEARVSASGQRADLGALLPLSWEQDPAAG
jgi:hypothetical protein